MYLFQKDLFSNYTPLWSDRNLVNDDIGKAIINVINLRYGFIDDNIILIRSYGGVDVNSKNFIVTTPTKEVTLKILNDDSKESVLKFTELERARHAYDLPIPQTFLNDQNLVATNFGDKKFMLSEYKSGNFFRGGKSEFILLKRAMQKIIDYSDHIDLNNQDNLKFDVMSFRSNLGKIFDGDFNCSAELKSDYAAILKDNHQNLLDLTLEVEWFDFEQFDTSSYHLDLHPHNIIVSESECTLIDLDSFSKISLSQFIGFTLFKLIRQQRSLNINDFIASEFVDFINVKDSQKVDLSLQVLRIHAIREILRRLSIILNENIIHGVSRWNNVIPVHLIGLRECNALFKE